MKGLSTCKIMKKKAEKKLEKKRKWESSGK